MNKKVLLLRIFLSLLILILPVFITVYNIIFSSILAICFFIFSKMIYLKLLKNFKKNNLEYQSYFFIISVYINLKTSSILDSLNYASSHIKCDLSNYFKISLKEINNGLSFNESFENLKAKFDLPYLIRFIDILILYTNNKKTLLIKLKELCKDLEKENVLKENSRIKKLPINVIIFSFLFIIPIIILLIITPLIIEKFI